MLIKPKSTFDSFNLAPEGRNTFVFNGEIIPTANQSLRFVCEYENDPSAKVSVFGGQNNLRNMEALMGIIYCSGVGEKIRKKKPNVGDPKDGWDEDVLKNVGLIEQIRVDIIGCKIDLDIYHVPAKWTDGEGKQHESFNARVKEMFECANSAKGVSEEPATTQEF